MTHSARDALSNSPAIADILGGQVERGFLNNLEEGRENQFLFNPVQLRETYKANYARHGAPGLSHKRMQFTGNENTKIPLTLVFDQVVFNQRKAGTGGVRQGGGENDVEATRRKFLEMIYPRRGQRLASVAPAQVLFVWPGMISMRVRLTVLTFRHSLFVSRRPLPRIMVVDVALEEDVEERIYAEDMLLTGTFRPWATSNARRGRRR